MPIVTTTLSPFKITDMDAGQLSQNMPHRTQVPPEVAAVLSIAETVTGWSKWQAEYGKQPRSYFFEGIVDYWWDNELVEPTWDTIFPSTVFEDSNSGIPSRDRFCYQQGAIVGYQLREEYK